MKDGHLNKCKECTKRDSLEHRNSNIEKIRAYDRSRGNRHGEGYLIEYRKRFPNKYKALTAVSNAIRSGKIIRPDACSECDLKTKVVGHHDDYLKPLNVRWICQACHKQWHAKNGEGKNGKM